MNTELAESRFEKVKTNENFNASTALSNEAASLSKTKPLENSTQRADLKSLPSLTITDDSKNKNIEQSRTYPNAKEQDTNIKKGGEPGGLPNKFDSTTNVKKDHARNAEHDGKNVPGKPNLKQSDTNVSKHQSSAESGLPNRSESITDIKKSQASDYSKTVEPRRSGDGVANEAQMSNIPDGKPEPLKQEHLSDSISRAGQHNSSSENQKEKKG